MEQLKFMLPIPLALVYDTGTVRVRQKSTCSEAKETEV